MSLPGASSVPAADANQSTHGHGVRARRVAQMVWEDLRPADVLTPEALDNAIVALAAMGGSTNAYIHLIAIARRAGWLVLTSFLAEFPLSPISGLPGRCPLRESADLDIPKPLFRAILSVVANNLPGETCLTNRFA